MKRLFIALISLVTLLSCQTNKVNIIPAEGRIMKFEELSELFVNPPAEYASAPLWVWNDDMNEKEIDIQLAEFKSVGIEGVYVHPRPGLITEYLSDEWFRLFRYSIDKAKELGMYVWIYDENSYPSGFAGGHVPAQMPESYKHGNGLRLHKQDLLQPDDELEYKFIMKKEEGKYIDISSSYKSEIGKEGNYYLYELTHYQKADWYGGHTYVDLLVEGVTEKFLEVTMTGYEKVVGDEFGKTMPGVFTDEPNLTAGKPNDAVRWTPDLFNKFEAKWNYKLEDNLICLFEEEGDWKKVRHNYYQLILQLFVDMWAKPWYNYCEEKGIYWTGHYWEHGWPHPQHGGDNMAMYAWHTQPGIDMLFNNYNDTSYYAGMQFGNIRSVKELASVANQYGYKRTLSETYGGGGWMETFEDFKRLGDWEYALGVNHMNQHLAFATLKGVRKYDYPPTFTYQEPWFAQYKLLGEYYKRLSLALSSGEQINDILIIEPTTSAWMYSKNMKGEGWRANYMEEAEKIGSDFHMFLLELERNQVEYDLGSENIIKDVGNVKGNSFVINKRQYKLVVLPPGTENIDKRTFELLKDFTANGGKLLLMDNLTRIDGSVNDELKQLLSNQNISKDRSVLYAENGLKFNIDNKGKVYHQRRYLNDGQLIFIVNSSLKESTSGNFSVKGEQLIEMDLFSGKLCELKAEKEEGDLSYSYNIPPAGSILLFASNKTYKGISPAKEQLTNEKVIKVSKTKVEMCKPNVLTLDYVDIEFAGKKISNVYFDAACDELFKSSGFENGNPWFHAIQYKQTILEKDKYNENTSFKVNYKFDVESKLSDLDINSLKVVVETPELWEVTINGNVVKPVEGSWWIDRSFPEYNIGKHIKKGTNVIELSALKMSVHAEIVPVYITGLFSLEAANKSFSIVAKKDITFGSWKNQGIPFYYHSVKYSKEFSLEEGKNYTLKLNDWKGITTEVLINGKTAGQIFAQPHSLDISEYISGGENTVDVIVYGSHRNLFGPHHNPKMDGSGPWDWKNSPKHQPAGAEYIFMDYGLMEDFELIQN